MYHFFMDQDFDFDLKAIGSLQSLSRHNLRLDLADENLLLCSTQRMEQTRKEQMSEIKEKAKL